MNLPGDPTLYLFAESNGAGKTTFARAYLRQPNPQKLAAKAGKLLLHEIQDCLESGNSFGLENTLSGTTYTKLLQQARSIGFQIEIHYLWSPAPSLAI